jgi:hypothetical protein
VHAGTGASIRITAPGAETLWVSKDITGPALDDLVASPEPAQQAYEGEGVTFSEE